MRDQATLREESQDVYMTQAANCLALYQMIEAALRSILPLLYSRANDAMPPGMCCKWTERELSKASLGKLIDRLAQIYDADPELIKNLRSLVNDRNVFAHSALGLHWHLGFDANTYLSKCSDVTRKMEELNIPMTKLIDLFGRLRANECLEPTSKRQRSPRGSS